MVRHPFTVQALLRILCKWIDIGKEKKKEIHKIPARTGKERVRLTNVSWAAVMNRKRLLF